jgi:hypothetical protein
LPQDCVGSRPEDTRHRRFCNDLVDPALPPATGFDFRLTHIAKSVPDQAGRNAGNDGVGFDIARDDSPCSNDRAISDSSAAPKHYHPVSDPDIMPDGQRIFRVRGNRIPVQQAKPMIVEERVKERPTQGMIAAPHDQFASD